MNNGKLRVAWVSRHAPLKSQLEELKRIFRQEPDVVQVGRQFKDAAEIIQRCQSMRADEVMVVAPLGCIEVLCNRGLKPIVSKMRQVDFNDPSAETHIGQRAYKFEGFRRVVRLEMVTEPVTRN